MFCFIYLFLIIKSGVLPIVYKRTTLPMNLWREVTVTAVSLSLT